MLGYLIVVVVGLFYLVYWVVDDLDRSYRESVEEALVDTATMLASVAALDVVDRRLDTTRLEQAIKDTHEKSFSARIYDIEKNHVDLRVYVTNSHGTVVYDSFESANVGKDFSDWPDVYLTLDGQYGARTTRDDPSDPHSSVLYVAAPISHGGEIVGTLTVGKPTRALLGYIAIAKENTIIGGTITFFVVTLLMVLISAWVKKPIDKLTEYARAVRDGKRIKLPKLGAGEVAELGVAFDEMRDALEGKKYVEEYVQTLTHELKSPLTAVQGAAELLEEGVSPEASVKFVANIKKESARMRRMVERMLELAALESAKGLEKSENVKLPELVHEAVASLALQTEQKGITLRIDELDELSVQGDPFLLSHALSNIIGNAIEFTPTGGEISVTLRKDGSAAVITVRDNGPGIPDYALERIFERFYSLERPESGKKSSGLGLAVVKEIANLHSGSISVTNQASGSGVRAELRIPQKQNN